MTNAELKALLERDFLKGYEILFKEYYAVLHRMASSLVKDTVQAEDIVQQFFVKASTTLRASKIQSLEAYLYISIKHECYNHLRKHKRECALELAQEKASEHNAQQMLEQHELRQQIGNALASLPHKCRSIFEKGYLEGLSHEQIAKTEKISVNTVSNQMTKALRLLRVQLAPAARGFFSFFLVFSFLK